MSAKSIWPFLPSARSTSVTYAEGAYIYFDDGSKILDAAGGAIVSNIGHGRVEVADAVRDALVNCSYIIPPWLTEQRSALIHELRDHWLPSHLTRIHLASGGSEANEAAIKMAIQYHASKGDRERNVILARSISYHGTTISTAAVSGHPGRKRGLESILNEHPRILTPYPLHCPLGPHHESATDFYLKNLEDTIQSVGPEKIAALIAEPINGSSGGAITPPDGYWERAQEILKQHGILLIMDEVMTGFGRTGYKFGSDLYGIKPDLLVAGKGMASGYAAIAGVYGTDEIAETISGGGYDVMFHTFGALPQSCVAATTVLQILRQESLLAHVKEVGSKLKDALQDRFSQHPLIAEIRGEGLLIGIEIVADRETLEPFAQEARITDKVIGYSMGKGVFFYPGGTGEIRDIVCIGAPFIIGDVEIELMVETLDFAINEILKSTS